MSILFCFCFCFVFLNFILFVFFFHVATISVFLKSLKMSWIPSQKLETSQSYILQSIQPFP